jgi:hypothetical protein
MLKDRQIIYTAAAPTADFNADGKMDIYLSSWWTEAPSILLKNETQGGHWLQVKVRGAPNSGISRDGIGAKILVYAAGDKDKLLGSYEIAAGYGYSSGQEALAHIGLGEREKVDLVIHLPNKKEPLRVAGVTADQRLVVDAK